MVFSFLVKGARLTVFLEFFCFDRKDLAKKSMPSCIKSGSDKCRLTQQNNAGNPFGKD